MKLSTFPLIHHTLVALRNGSNDPTTVWNGQQFWRSMHTSKGPATLHLLVTGSDVTANAVGPGAHVALERVDSLLGSNDHYPDMFTQHPVVARAQHKFGLLKLGATLDPYHELLPAVLGQRVTAKEASIQWRRLCTDLGEVAPAFPGAPTLFLPPEPAALRKLPYWKFHRYGIERHRAQTLTEVARHENFLLRLVTLPPQDATNQLQKIAGVGPWTAAVAGLAAFGDSDALCVGDFHAKNTIAFALTGTHRGTDEEMCRLLSSYAPHRARVLRWLQLDGWNAPAHGPRRPNLNVALM